MRIANLINSFREMLVVQQMSNSLRKNPGLEHALLIVLVCLIMFEPTIAAADNEPWTDVAQKIKGILQGPLVTAIATIGVVALGIMGLAGKLAWDTAIKVIIGITLIFGATKLVTFFGSAAGLAPP